MSAFVRATKPGGAAASLLRADLLRLASPA